MNRILAKRYNLWPLFLPFAFVVDVATLPLLLPFAYFEASKGCSRTCLLPWQPPFPGFRLSSVSRLTLLPPSFPRPSLLIQAPQSDRSSLYVNCSARNFTIWTCPL